MSQLHERIQPFRSQRVTWTPKLIGALVLLALSLILILQNWDKVNVNVFFWDFNVRLVWALLAIFLLGILTGWLVPRLFAATHRPRVRVTTSSSER
jgi:uncharacterized integral membrane protein